MFNDNNYFRLLATTSADTSVKIWRTADFSLMTELKEPNQRWVWDCAFSGDSQYIITGNIFTELKVMKCIYKTITFNCIYFRINGTVSLLTDHM